MALKNKSKNIILYGFQNNFLSAVDDGSKNF